MSVAAVDVVGVEGAFQPIGRADVPKPGKGRVGKLEEEQGRNSHSGSMARRAVVVAGASCSACGCVRDGY